MLTTRAAAARERSRRASRRRTDGAAGLLLFLMGFADPAEPPRHALWGAIWENLVVGEVRKAFLVRGRRPPLWFWRTSGGDEVDLLIEVGPERFLVVECKTAAKVDAAAVRGLRPLMGAHGEDAVVKAYVVCRTELPYPLAAGGVMEAVPLAGPGGLLARQGIGS